MEFLATLVFLMVGSPSFSAPAGDVDGGWSELAVSSDGGRRIDYQLVATLWSTWECAGGPGATSGDMLALIGLRGGEPVIRPLARCGRTSCAFLESATRDAIRLRSLDGTPSTLAFSHGKGRELRVDWE